MLRSYLNNTGLDFIEYVCYSALLFIESSVNGGFSDLTTMSLLDREGVNSISVASAIAIPILEYL